MTDVIKELFEQNGFKHIKSGNNSLFVPTDIRPTEEYWFVTKCAVSTILDKQEEFYEACKNVYTHKALDKNISLIILWETDGKIPTQELKNQIMQIEENPYFFKKYVFYFSSKELEEFSAQKGDIPINEFIRETMVKREIFDKYKQNPYVLSWESFLYRLTIKIPFISISIQESVGLESLFEVNRSDIDQKSMLAFNDHLLGAISKLLGSNNKFSGEELFKEIWPFFGEVNDGD